MDRKWKRKIFGALGALGFALFGFSGLVRADGAWKLEQLTVCSEGTSFSPQVSATGDRVYFLSTCDFVHRNHDHSPEIMKWESGEIEQLTEVRECEIKDLALAPDDRQLAFSSNCSFDGQNDSNKFEIALLTPGEKVKVLTNSGGVSSSGPVWINGGTALVFQSRADYLDQNPDRSSEIFNLDVRSKTPAIKQLTHGVPPGGCVAPNAGGAFAACQCDADLPLPENKTSGDGAIVRPDGAPTFGNPDHNREIVLIKEDQTIVQLTKTMGCNNGPPALHPLGAMVAISSNCPLQLGDGLGGENLFLLFPDRAIRLFPQARVFGFNLAWSGDGRRLAMASPYKGDGKNPEANQEIILIDAMPKADPGPDQEIQTPNLIRITEFTHGTTAAPALNRDGTVIVFVATVNLDSKNEDAGAELFIARELDPAAEELPDGEASKATGPEATDGTSADQLDPDQAAKPELKKEAGPGVDQAQDSSPPPKPGPDSAPTDGPKADPPPALKPEAEARPVEGPKPDQAPAPPPAPKNLHEEDLLFELP